MDRSGGGGAADGVAGRSVSVRRAARQAERDEKTRQKEPEDARSRAYAAGQEDAKAASRVAENVSAADSRENP